MTTTKKMKMLYAVVDVLFVITELETNETLIIRGLVEEIMDEK